MNKIYSLLIGLLMYSMINAQNPTVDLSLTPTQLVEDVLTGLE